MTGRGGMGKETEGPGGMYRPALAAFRGIFACYRSP